MAAEVMRTKFLFRPVPPFDFDINKKRKVVEVLPFCYNAIHDIESAWWVGVWMLFFYMPKGYNESSQISSERRHETDMIFPGTFNSACRLEILRCPDLFEQSFGEWISEECFPAVNVFEYVRLWLLKFYRDLEKTFPDGLGKLSEKAQAYPDGHHDAFPGSPDDSEAIYKLIQDAFLEVKELYELRKTEIVGI